MDLNHLSTEEICAQLAVLFDAPDHSFSIDSNTDTLFVQIQGLYRFTETEIERLAGPFLEDLESEFEEIILVSL